MSPRYAQFVKSLSRPTEAWLLSTVGRFHLLPESYLYGLADVRNVSDFYTSYAFGKIYPKGVWFYFPVAFAIKSSLSFLILLLLAIWAMAARKLTAWREIVFLTIPPAHRKMKTVNLRPTAPRPLYCAKPEWLRSVQSSAGA